MTENLRRAQHLGQSIWLDNTDDLERDGVATFTASYDDLLKTLTDTSRRAAAGARGS